MGTKLITSQDNQDFKRLKSLLRSRGINAENRAIISGPKFISEVLNKHPHVAALWITPSGWIGESPPQVATLNHFELSKALFDEIDEAGTKSPLLVINLPEIAKFDQSQPWDRGLHLILPLQNPENMGAVIRSAAAFAVTRVIITSEGANPFLPKALRASGINVLNTKIEYAESISKFKTLPVPSYIMDLNGEDIGTTKFPETCAIVIGMEGSGTETFNLEAKKLSIPISNEVDSLNATVAASILLYRYYSE